MFDVRGASVIMPGVDQPPVARPPISGEVSWDGREVSKALGNEGIEEIDGIAGIEVIDYSHSVTVSTKPCPGILICSVPPTGFAQLFVAHSRSGPRWLV